MFHECCSRTPKVRGANPYAGMKSCLRQAGAYGVTCGYEKIGSYRFYVGN